MTHAEFRELQAAYHAQFGCVMDLDGDIQSLQFFKGWVMSSKLTSREH